MQKAVGLNLTARRGLVVGAVAVVHLGVLLSHTRAAAPVLPPEMAVSLVTETTSPLAAPAQAAPTTPPVARPVVRAAAPALPVAMTPPPAVLPNPVIAPLSPVASQSSVVPVKAAVSPAPALPDRKPDYQASYLNNPHPAYPAMALRMGWQGKVMLSVEVLRDGRAGQVSVQRSSGHAVLDNAALQAVRAWRFVPARRDGQLVDETFFVPLPFELKDSDE